MATNLYEILEISKDATPEQIRKAYKQRALQTHPDRLPPGISQEDKAASEELFRQVNNAYEVLTDSQKRRAYDLHGVWPPSGPQAVPTPHRNDSSSRKPHSRHPNHVPRNNLFSDFMFGDSFFAFTDPFVMFDSVFEDIQPGHPHRHRHPTTWFASELSRMLHNDLSDPFGGLGFPSFGPSMLSHEPFSFPPNGNRGAWKSERYVTSTVNGITQTLHHRRDWNGNEHVTRSYADGREVHTINGVEQPPRVGYVPPANQLDTQDLLPPTSSWHRHSSVRSGGHQQPYPTPPPYPGHEGGYSGTPAVAEYSHSQHPERTLSETRPKYTRGGSHQRRWWGDRT